MAETGAGLSIRTISSRDIWLVLDDSHHDGGRCPGLAFHQISLITFGEMETYHRQLFYWLLIRYGPCPFPGAGLREGVPAWLAEWN